jgi:hypothetical protein
MWPHHEWTKDHPKPADCGDTELRDKSPTFVNPTYKPSLPEVETIQPPTMIKKVPAPEEAPVEEEEKPPEPEEEFPEIEEEMEEEE